MEGTTSTSNEGSKKRDLNKYRELKTTDINKNDLESLLAKNDYTFSINCMAYDVKNNVKTADNSSNPVSASSADTKEFDLAEILKNAPWSKVRAITPEKLGIITKKRKSAKAKKQAEKEAREAAEAEKEARESAEVESLNPTKKSFEEK